MTYSDLSSYLFISNLIFTSHQSCKSNSSSHLSQISTRAASQNVQNCIFLHFLIRVVVEFFAQFHWKRANKQAAQDPRRNNPLPQTLPQILKPRPQPPPYRIGERFRSRKCHLRPSYRPYPFRKEFIGNRRALARRL